MRKGESAQHLLVRLRGDLAGLTSKLADGLDRGIHNSSDAVRKTVRELMETDVRSGRTVSDATQRENSRRPAPVHPGQYRRLSIPSGADSPSSFDPSMPAGIRNMPPNRDLQFTAAPAGMGGNDFVGYQDKVLGILKIAGRGSSIRGVANEINAPLIAKRLGLEGIVPDVVEWRHASEWGSLQEFVPNRGYVSDESVFRGLEGRKIAAFDYIVAAQDRNLGNALMKTEPVGGIAAIDNEQIMHLPNIFGADRICSEFVYRNKDRELEGVVDILADTDPAGFDEFMRGLGYPEEDSMNSALRLVEIQEHGKIIGDAPGPAIVKPPTQSEIDAFVREMSGIE
ncbi:hypothetical protein [Nocardia carnea]|uniref:hypothetical protein n=1 Tax=Nocardia carnea TaxID=37328 RepID=UPI00245637B4|nr:hypothetical protein [Nocardia carnea]